MLLGRVRRPQPAAGAFNELRAQHHFVAVVVQRCKHHGGQGRRELERENLRRQGSQQGVRDETMQRTLDRHGVRTVPTA